MEFDDWICDISFRNDEVKQTGVSLFERQLIAVRQSHRPGISLLELLVVIVIVGVLIGLLLSAVQHVRAMSVQIQCQNNLKQIGLALHGYQASGHLFPPGVSKQAEQGAYPFMSWNTRILPFLEQESLWRDAVKAYEKDKNFLNNPPHSNRGLVVKAFVCPSDPRSLESKQMAGSGLSAFTSYLGVEGTNQFEEDGMLFLDSAVRMEDVTDGTSNTLLVGERPPSADGNFGWWYAGWGQSKDGSAEMVLGVHELYTYWAPGCSSGPYNFGPGNLTNQCDAFHFWSTHSDGGHFLFVDGSVHFIRYGSGSILDSLATRAGGEFIHPW